VPTQPRLDVKNPVNKFLKALFVWEKSDLFALKSYSQEGEDMILRRIFEGRTTSKFYVDVGAHHPYRFSNTYFFYKQGWNGINIDAMPDSMKAFTQERARDINLEIAIAKKREVLKYTQFNISALNSFSQDLIEARKSLPSVNVIAEKEIEAYPLATVLSNYLPSGQAIAFLSIDVEGLDLQVLESNDWSRFRPYVVLVEIQQSSLHSIQNSPIYQYIVDQDYYLYAKAFHTVFFISKEYWSEYFN
jgi:FkbM family methyltransferase